MKKEKMKMARAKNQKIKKEKDVDVLFLLLFSELDEKNKEYIAERAGTFVSNDGKPHPIRSVFISASKHDTQRSFHASSLVFAEGCIYNRNEEHSMYIHRSKVCTKNGRKKKQ